MDNNVLGPGVERWRVILGGVNRLLSDSSEQPGLNPELAALAGKTRSRLWMFQQVVAKITSSVAGAPDQAPVLSPHTDAVCRALFDALPVGVAVLQPGGGAPLVNMPASEMLGLDVEAGAPACKAEPAQAYDLFHTDETRFSPGEYPLARLERGEEFYGLACKCVNRRGERVAALLSGGRADAGDPSSPLLLVGLDVTELKRLEHAREELLQVMSHEIRNPLQVMKSLVQMALMGLSVPSREEVGSYLEALENQVDVLSAFMNDALQAYRDTSAVSPFRIEKIDLGDVVAGAVEPYVADANGHTILIDAAAARGAVVRGDRQRLAGVLRNLMSNALKYSPEGARVWVKAEIHGAEALLTVEDEGVGIPPGELERIFEGFYRRKDLSGWHTNGMGLGLYISRIVARRHGGDLWAENRPGGGATMRFRLPLGFR